MELTNEFTVDIPVEEAWTVLTDVTRIAPCMPGAQLQEVTGDEYRGIVKVKVGPITAEYRGKATFVEQDQSGHRAVLRAEGREARGQGNASATVTATLEPSGDGTKVSVMTDLVITGRVAQFGRGVLADVSTKLLGQFVESLESTVLAGQAPGAPGAEPAGAEPAAAGTAGGGGGETAGGGTPSAGPVGSDRSEQSSSSPSANGAGDRAAASAEPAAAPVDLVQVAGPALLKRALPVLAGVLALWGLWRLWRFQACRRR